MCSEVALGQAQRQRAEYAEESGRLAREAERAREEERRCLQEQQMQREREAAAQRRCGRATVPPAHAGYSAV